MMTLTLEKSVSTHGQMTPWNNLGEEVESMVAEMMDELDMMTRNYEEQDVVDIRVPPVNSDLSDPREAEQARLAVLKKRIAEGSYKVDPLTIARNMMLRGDV
jgi:hypothetical protein